MKHASLNEHDLPAVLAWLERDWRARHSREPFTSWVRSVNDDVGALLIGEPMLHPEIVNRLLEECDHACRGDASRLRAQTIAALFFSVKYFRTREEASQMEYSTAAVQHLTSAAANAILASSWHPRDPALWPGLPPRRAALEAGEAPPPPQAGAPRVTPVPASGLQHAHFYVSRDREESQAWRLFDAADPVILRGPDGIGKTVLLRHLLREIGADGERRGAAPRVVEASLSSVGREAIHRFDLFAARFAEVLVRGANVDGAWVERVQRDARGWRLKLEDMFEQAVLAEAPGLVILAIHRADFVWGARSQADFFGMLRDWCELGQRRPGWEKLRLLMSLSTTHTLSGGGPEDWNSPWSLASPVEIEDFSREQIETFARHHLPGCGADAVDVLSRRVGGHPLLLRSILQEAAGTRAPLTEIIDAAELGLGAQATTLNGIGRALLADAAVARAVCEVLEGAPHPPGGLIMERLRHAGVVRASPSGYRIRFPLLHAYLQRTWRPALG